MPRALPVLITPRLAELAGLSHAFFTRQGGVSGGIYGTLNCGPGSQDDPQAVAANRDRAARHLGAAGAGALATLYQVHGRDVVTVTGRPGAERPKADALVTDRDGIALGVLAADCTPVLFADPQARVIGAAHAGWKGALAGVTDATIEAMERLGARRDRIIAAIGPTIRQVSYEVGEEFPRPFLDQDAANARFFAAGRQPGKFQFDLPGYVAARLRTAGVGTVEDTGRDTLAEPTVFFSYRRATLAGEPDYGRQLSAIMLAG